MTETTTIQVTKETHAELKNKAKCKDETFDSIIKRLMNMEA